MEDKLREHIIRNTEKLISLTDYKKLMHACVYSNLISPAMRQFIEDVRPTLVEEPTLEQLQHEQHKHLFLKLTKRGPDAYQHLKSILSELKFEEALRVLNEPRNDDTQFVSLHRNKRPEERSTLETPNPLIIREHQADGQHLSKGKNNEDEAPMLELYTQDIPPKVKHTVIKSKELHFDSKVGTYPMKTQHNRGVFFMVNIINFPNEVERRNGAERDGESLLYLFKELGFKLFAYKNLTQKDFFRLLDAVIDSQYTRKAECFVMALMTHGNMDENLAERVQFHDGSIAKVRDIEDRFENQKCQHLVHKPKIFIFPFCRGEIPDPGYALKVQTDTISYGGVPRHNTISSLSDIIICYASRRGFKSHRDSEDGSWYIQKFCELVAKHAHDTSLEDILKMIQRETSNLRTEHGHMQMGSYINIGFNHKLFFNPGVYEDYDGST